MSHEAWQVVAPSIRKNIAVSSRVFMIDPFSVTPQSQNKSNVSEADRPDFGLVVPMVGPIVVISHLKMTLILVCFPPKHAIDESYQN